jgi:hypothetical protein
MADDETVESTSSGAQQQVDAEPFYRRVGELQGEWDGLREAAQSSGNTANTTDLVIRLAGFFFAAAATLISTLLAAEVEGSLVSATKAAILAALATIATGIQASGMFRNRAKHHYERVDAYRIAHQKAGNLKAQVESRSLTVHVALSRLNKLSEDAGKRPEMP